jgi:Ala-tRNA(Pro) deacylase
MDEVLKKFLDANHVEYQTHLHPPVFTVEESKKLKKIPGVLDSKNLFLKDEAGNFYLVCMYAHEKLNLKNLKEKIHAVKKLTFCSSEELKQHLNVSPGSVSIFSMIYAKDVMLIIDKRVWDAEKSGFHPNVNTATLEINRENLRKFCEALKSNKLILNL